jgi:hypothetical protein
VKAVAVPALSPPLMLQAGALGASACGRRTSYARCSTGPDPGPPRISPRRRGDAEASAYAGLRGARLCWPRSRRAGPSSSSSQARSRSAPPSACCSCTSPQVDAEVELGAERVLEGDELDVLVTLSAGVGAERVEVLLQLPRELVVLDGITPCSSPTWTVSAAS